MSGEIQKQFLVTSKIGNGNFSTVYLAKHIQTQQIVAVKTMKNHIPIAIKQAQILKKISHPNIIKLYKFQKPKHKQQALMVLQYVPQNILQLYESQQYGLKQDQVKCILFQSCMGLYHIHKKGIIHRDIKPQNIMINRNKAEVKLIDFGLAIQQDQCVTDYVATRWYRAPQNLLGTKEYTVAIDIFSLGCVVVQLYMGNPLFPGANNIDQISKIFSIIQEPNVQTWKKGHEMLHKLGLNFNVGREKKKTTLKTLLSSCSEGLSKIIQKMLILNPFKRITAEQILKDGYFKDIQKIIPPHVYDQYLADFVNTRTSMIKEIPRIEKRNESKQRIRFLSEQKSFGAFSSFKPNNPLNKFQKQYTKERQKYPLHKQQKAGSIKKLSLEKIVKDYGPGEQDRGQIGSLRKSGASEFVKNQIIKDPSSQIRQNPTTNITDFSSSIKNSIEKYESNIVKLSTSLQNMKFLKSASQLNTEKNQNQDLIQNNELKNAKSSQLLSFRGFNQPKQKVSIKETGPTFYKKYPALGEEKLNKFPIKNKKVMEYLQKFQTITNHSHQLEKHKLQNSRSQPIIHQSVNASPKKPQLLVTHGTKQFLTRQNSQKEHLQQNLANSSLQLNLLENGSLQQNSSSRNLHSKPFKAELMQSNESFSSRPNDMVNYPKIRSQDLRRSFEIQRTSNFQSPSRHSMQQPLIKFGSFIKSEQEIKNHFIPVHTQMYSSNVIAEDTQNMQTLSGRSSQTFFKEPKSLNSSNYLGNSRTIINPPSSMNISSNRPIQNKIKLIAVRDNVPANSFQQIADQSQFLEPGFISNPNASRNLSYYKSSPNFVENSHPLLFSQSSLQSAGKQVFYIHSSQQQIYPSEFQPKPNFFDFNQQKTKQFKSLQHRQFFSKKTPSNRYSVNTSEDTLNIGYTSNYPLTNETVIRNEIKPILQKNHQTTLSQLRQSITGLTQSLNEGAFLSDRSQKYNNKNININLNLNIYEKRGPSKR